MQSNSQERRNKIIFLPNVDNRLTQVSLLVDQIMATMKQVGPVFFYLPPNIGNVAGHFAIQLNKLVWTYFEM
jgi:hypothetical protein